MTKNIIKYAFINAFATTVYIFLVALFLFNISGGIEASGKETILIPVLMLSLLVFSAALVGVLIFGRPVLWYLSGRQKDAIYLLLATLGVFLVITLVILLLLLYLV